MITAELKIKKPKILSKRIIYRPIKNINVFELNNDLNKVDWDAIIQLNSVDNMVESFNKIILALFNKHAPERTFIARDRYSPWLTSNVRFIKKLRDEARAKYRASKTEENKSEYIDLKKLSEFSAISEKKAYYEHHINVHLRNSFYLWKNLKKHVLPDFKNTGDLPEHFNSPDTINEHFLNIPGHNVVDPSFLEYFETQKFSTASNFHFKTVQENVVAKVILEIKSNAQGIDKINMDMIILTLPTTLNVITAIINESILSSKFPSLWKMALVLPLPKSSNPEGVKDLRPISILPYMSKILEKVIYNQIINYCESNNILPYFQSGFRKHHSTSSALSDVIDNILTCQDSGRGSILALLDFSRAFDSINIKLMLAKLSYYGFSSTTVQWFASYLQDRMQKVVIRKNDGNDLISALKPVNRGVPQGSILGPLLFIMYSSDIVNCIKNIQYHLYADDLQLYIPVNPQDVSRAVDQLNNVLNNISRWCQSNSLILNPLKSKFMILGTKMQVSKILANQPKLNIDGINIEHVHETRNLGLRMDEHLRFENHVVDLTRNCFYRLKVLYKIRPYITINLRIKLCDSLILSKLNYCITVYGPCLFGKSWRLIQRIQNACARFCFPIPPRSHVTPFLNEKNVLKMKNRYHLLVGTLLFGVIKTKLPPYLYNKLRWREPSFGLRTMVPPLAMPRHRSAAFRGSFKYLATKCWNDIPPPVRKASSKFVFKKLYRTYLLQIQKSEK